MRHQPSKLDVEVRLEIAREMIDDLRKENSRLTRKL
jgi:hypothetical protein